MRILVDCCNYFLDNNNIGDMAIYKVLAMRLAHFWPKAKISWITLDPDLILQTIPTVLPFTLQQRHHWQLFDSAQQTESGSRGILSRLQGRPHLNSVQKSLMKTNLDVDRFVRKFREVDLVLALGGGSFSDHFADHSRGILDTLEGGLAFNKPVALLSAGFEEISNASLLEKCKRVLPQLKLIACREPHIGPNLLSSLNTPADRVFITGDEAIELAYSLRSAQPGQALGINLRQSSYSEIEEKWVNSIRIVLHEAGYKNKAALLGVPISLFGPSDVESIEKIIFGYDAFTDSGKNLDTPELVIQQVGRCRIVITGSYHSAVFALAQGIPVVAIARSHHYKIKLAGLKAQFRHGCNLLDPEDANFEKNLQYAMDELWNEAPFLKEPLLEMARSQIDESWRATYKLFDLMANGKGGSNSRTNMLKSTRSIP